MDEITVNGVRIAYQRIGAGRPVLLIGGTGMPPEVWGMTGLQQGLVDAGCEVVSYAARGVAPSDAPPAPYRMTDMAADAAALLDSLGLTGVTVVGYSLGGLTAETLAHLRPDLVASLVLIAGAGPTSGILRIVNDMNTDMLGRTGTISTSAGTVYSVLTGLPPAQLRDYATVIRFADMMNSDAWTSPEGKHGQAAAELDWVEDTERMGRLAEITVPATVICFEHDLLFPSGNGQEAAKSLPHGEFVEIEGGAHFGPITHSAQTLEALRAHLARL